MQDLFLTLAVWCAIGALAGVLGPRLGTGAAVVEIVLGFAAAALGLPNSAAAAPLSVIGAILIAFLAGIEVDHATLKHRWRACLVIGGAAFLPPLAAVYAVAVWVMKIDPTGAAVMALALAETSIAVTYAVLVETGMSRTEVGKLVLASVFVTNMAAVGGLAVLLFDRTADPHKLALMLAGGAAAVALMLWLARRPALDPAGRVPGRAVLAALLALAALAADIKMAAVLPAYVVGVLAAGRLSRAPQIGDSLRGLAFIGFTSFYFARVGSLIDPSAFAASWPAMAALLLAKLSTKFAAVWMVLGFAKVSARERLFAAAVTSSGLTFGSFIALFGRTESLLDQRSYAALIGVIVLSAVLPALAANRLRRTLSPLQVTT